MAAPDQSIAPAALGAPEALRDLVAELVEEHPDDVAEDANLFELGLDSIELMRVVGDWRRAGAVVDFAELAAAPTLKAWTALLIDRLPGDGSDDAREATTAVGPVTSVTSGALAPMQHAYWIGRGDGQPLGGVAAHLYTEFDGAGVDPGRLEEAVSGLVARHPMLRAVFTDPGVQRIDPRGGWRGLVVHDLRQLDPEGGAAALKRTRDLMSHGMLDVEGGEVLATALSLLPDGRTRLHLDVDMLAADAVSYRILLADLAGRYADPTMEAEPTAFTYLDYLAARAAHPPAQEEARAHWTARLDDLPGAPELPTAPGRTVGAGPARVARRRFALDPGDRNRLAVAARRLGVTPAAAVATVFAEVVGAWSATPRFLLNVPLFDREPLHPGVAGLVGDFTGSVLLEIDLTDTVPLAERARRLQDRLHTDAARAAYSGLEVLRDLGRRRGEQVLAPVVFTSALGLGELFAPEVRRSFGDPVWIISQGPQVLLDSQVTEVDGGLLVNWDLREPEFAPGVTDAMFAAFEFLLRHLVTSPTAWDAPAPDLRPETQRAVRARVNDDAAGSDTPGRLHDAFFDRARTAPDAPAVVTDSGEDVTFGELAERALRVARALTEHGVRPGDTVTIRLPAGPAQVAALLGVLAAGAAWVPIGIDQPAPRVERIDAVAAPAARIGGPDADLPIAVALAAPPADGPVAGTADDLAYVLFTSGSTGEPKGVEVPHRAAMATVGDLIDRLALGPGDRTLAVSAPDFDLTVFDVFAPLSTGGAVVVPDAAGRADAAAWSESLRRHGATVLNCAPPLLDMILASGVPLGDTLRAVLLGGDRVGVDLPGRLRAVVPGCRFLGLGGTTETAIHSTVQEVADPSEIPADWSCVPYGTPLRNVALRVVDVTGRDVPDWVPGELWIGGLGVARGYRGDPERTADRFVEHEGRRWYRTGDLARYRPDGTVEFLGRRDAQLSIRGFRVEPGEIEAALLDLPDVTGAVVTPVDSTLVAVVTGTAAASDELRRGVAERLPGHMVPDHVVTAETVPLTRNGKVDRAAVATLARESLGTIPRGPAPDGPVERALTHLWVELLDLPATPAATTDFFALGGDSVLATRVVTAVREDLDAPAMSVRMLMGAPTITGLAAALRAAEDDPARLDRVAELLCEIAELADDEVEAALDEGRDQ